MNFFNKYIIICLFTISTISGAHISESNRNIVLNTFIDAHIDDNVRNDISINNIDVVTNEQNNLLYIYHLNPVGFILISADYRAIPLLGYSFENDFILNNVPSNIE